MIPVLDLNVGLRLEDDQAPIKHYFYQKPMSSHVVITSSSSMPVKVKKLILINEGLRRIRNNCLTGPFSNNIETLRNFNIAMSASGHSEKFRLEVTNKIIMKYQIQLENDKNGSVSFYRNKQERRDYKMSDKVRFMTKTGWHTRFGFKAVLEIPPTPNSKLAQMVREELNSADIPRGYKVMVRESNGSSVKNKLCTFINPWPTTKCSRSKCFVCSSSDPSNSSNSSSSNK